MASPTNEDGFPGQSAVCNRRTIGAPDDAMVRTSRGTLRLARRSQATCLSDGQRGPAARRQPLGRRTAAASMVRRFVADRGVACVIALVVGSTSVTLAHADASAPPPSWASQCQADLLRARDRAARRDSAFAHSFVRFSQTQGSDRGFFVDEVPIVELVHEDYARIPDLGRVAFRVAVSQSSSRFATDEGRWHRPENGSLGDPNDFEVYEIKWVRGFKGKLELWSPSRLQRRIFEDVLRAAAEHCLWSAQNSSRERRGSRQK